MSNLIFLKPKNPPISPVRSKSLPDLGSSPNIAACAILVNWGIEPGNRASVTCFKAL